MLVTPALNGIKTKKNIAKRKCATFAYTQQPFEETV